MSTRRQPAMRLYSRLAGVYHEMYQSVFDYDAEFRLYHRILGRHGATRLLEIACGSGNLATRFLAAGYDYTGMDVAPEMLAIARTTAPAARYLEADMRHFSVRKKFDAAIVTGRSFAYLTTNREAVDALVSMRKALRPGGILAFDIFDAGKMFTNFSRRLVQRVALEHKTITRRSTMTMHLETGFTLTWDARYEIEEGGRRRTIEDRSVLRAFTRDEIRLLLALGGFVPLQIRRRPGYFVVVARRD